MTYRFAVFPYGIKHDTKNRQKDHSTNDQHKPVQPHLLFGDFGDRRVQVQLPHGRTAWKIIDSPCGIGAEHRQSYKNCFEFFENVVHHVFKIRLEKFMQLTKRL
jgi:hypothetical protein